VVANIPAAQIEAIENGVAVTRHTAVAGKPDRPSPDIQSKIVQINFNPFWTVPVSIIRKT
jgi:L,D-transpeptidase YcbB